MKRLFCKELPTNSTQEAILSSLSKFKESVKYLVLSPVSVPFAFFSFLVSLTKFS